MALEATASFGGKLVLGIRTVKMFRAGSRSLRPPVRVPVMANQAEVTDLGGIKPEASTTEAR